MEAPEFSISAISQWMQSQPGRVSCKDYAREHGLCEGCLGKRRNLIGQPCKNCNGTGLEPQAPAEDAYNSLFQQ